MKWETVSSRIFNLIRRFTLAAYLILCALYLIWQPEILHKTSTIDIQLIHKLNFSSSLVSNFILVSESQN